MAAPIINQKEYLKKYLSGPNKNSGKKKKKSRHKAASGTKPKTKIVDDDVDLHKIDQMGGWRSEEEEFGEEAPQIAAIIDERPAHLRDAERRTLGQWKTLEEPNGTHSRNNHFEGQLSPLRLQHDSKRDVSLPRQEKSHDSDISPPRQQRKRHDSDISPPRQRKRHDSDISPPRQRKRHDSDISPPRQRKSHDSDISPPRQRKRRDSDVSHPKQQRKRPESDISPPRERKRHDLDISPPRQQRKSHDLDISAPRQRKRHDSDISPPRQRKRHDSDISPPRQRNWRDSDISPPRQRTRHDSDISPPRQRTRHDSDISPPRQRKRHDSDNSPPRPLRKRHDSDISPPRQRERHDSHILPPRQQRKKQDLVISSPRQRKRQGSDISPPRQKKHSDSNKNTKRVSPHRRKDSEPSQSPEGARSSVTLSGMKAGLQNARTLREEVQAAKQREMDALKTMGKMSGQEAETVFRERETGKKRDFKEERRQKRKEAEKLAEQQEKYMEWGHGVKQTADRKMQLEDELYEMSKPLARYQDDPDLERHLKEQEREGDPMLEFIKKRKAKQNPAEKARPQYKGPPAPPNRFGIPPGYRWDGVDRSNGFEKKHFERISSKVAVQEEAYKWSISDM